MVWFLKPSSSTDAQHQEVISKVQEEPKYVARRSIINSILGKRDFNTLSSINFKEIIKEMKQLCPTVYEFFSMLEMDVDAERKSQPWP